MADQMNDHFHRYLKFEEFIAKLFVAYGLRIEARNERLPQGRNEVDFVVSSPNDTKAAVEVKAYSSLRVSGALIARALAQLETVKNETNSQVGLLVTNAQIPSSIKDSCSEEITVWDYDTISFLAGKSRILAREWEEIKQQGFINRTEPTPTPVVPDDLVLISEIPLDSDAIELTPSPPKGAELCKALKETAPGRKGKAATLFENAVTDALKYLFEDDLINWTPQKTTKENLHRYDLIARISSDNDFWNSMIVDHRARYIIFEFKNYGNKIKQTEIYSTEKYLFPQAMRSTAIIVSRKGADKNANRVMHGAFREAGKLIISLDIEDICKMLDMRDDGLDPAETLSELIDDMMMGIER